MRPGLLLTLEAAIVTQGAPTHAHLADLDEPIHTLLPACTDPWHCMLTHPAVFMIRAIPARWTDNVMLAAIGRVTSLRQLELCDADALDDSGLLALRGLKALRVLGLQRCRWVGDAGCHTLAQVGVGAEGAGGCTGCSAAYRAGRHMLALVHACFSS